MDAAAERAHFNYSQDLVMVAGSSDRAWSRGRRTVEAGGFRAGRPLELGSAEKWIEDLPVARAIWIEIDDEADAGLGAALAPICEAAASRGSAAIVSTPGKLLDAVYASAGADADVLVDADDAERAAALALAIARAKFPLRAGDVASDRSTERLRQLSDEVSRIAATLARLSSNPPVTNSAPEHAPAGAIPDLSAERVRAVIRARRLRSRYFPEHLFADPAWDMMLDLLQAEIAQLRVPVSSLCIAAAVPATTALRWLKTMVHEGLFLRRADPHDGRRVFVELAPNTSEALRRYFSEVGDPVAI